MSVIEVLPAHGKAVCLGRSQLLRLSTPKGKQAADFWAFTSDMTEWMSAPHTWARTNVVKPRQGDLFVSQLRNPMLAFARDGARGCHDMHIPACDSQRYREFGESEPHRSCAANLAEALAELQKETAITPQPINFFTNAWIGDNHELVMGDPREHPIEPGSFVVLEAVRDLVCVASSCPHDVAIPGWSLSDAAPSELELEVIG
ncbi:MAG: DUF1989 domain-containing protein [Solirubrobacteraceae bacterium]